jgi:hypothetical protein
VTKWVLIWLVVITTGAAWVRLAGIDVLLPHTIEPDPFMANQAVGIRDGTLDPHSVLARKYPQFMARLLAPMLPPRSPAVQASGETALDLDGHLAAARSPYLRVRIVVALFSLLMVPLTWWLLRRYSGDRGALLAAALVATSLLHTVNSQQVRPHAPAASFMLLALIAILAMRRAPNARTYLLAGVACGIAVATLQSALFVLPALGLAYLTRTRDGARLIDAWIALPTLVIAGFVLVFYVLAGRLTTGAASAFFEVGGLQHGLRLWNGGGFALLPVFLWEYDPALLVLAGVGLVWALATGRRRLDPGVRRDVLVIAAFALPYAIVIGVYDVTQARYLLPLMPLIAGLAAAGALFLVAIVSARVGSPTIAGGLMVASMLALPAYASMRLAHLQSGEDTLTAAARWLDEHVDHRDATLLISPVLDLPVFSSRPARRGETWGQEWSRHQARTRSRPADAMIWNLVPLIRLNERGRTTAVTRGPGLKEVLQEVGSGYLILDASREVRLDNQLAPSREWVSLLARFDALPAARQPDGSIRPRPDAGFLGHQDRRLLRRVLLSDRWGPPLRIYRFDVLPDGEGL